MFLENSQNSLENTCARVSFLIKKRLLEKRLWQRCFPVNFSKFLRTPFIQSTSGRQLLKFWDLWLFLQKNYIKNVWQGRKYASSVRQSFLIEDYRNFTDASLCKNGLVLTFIIHHRVDIRTKLNLSRKTFIWCPECQMNVLRTFSLCRVSIADAPPEPNQT